MKLIDGFENLSEVLRIQKKGMIKSIKCYAGISKNKNQVISKAYNSGGYAMRRDRIFFWDKLFNGLIIKNSRFKAWHPFYLEFLFDNIKCNSASQSISFIKIRNRCDDTFI